MKTKVVLLALVGVVACAHPPASSVANAPQEEFVLSKEPVTAAPDDSQDDADAAVAEPVLNDVDASARADAGAASAPLTRERE